ncbi:MAG TPA: glycosyltransferase family 2 protein, partial [Actinobacteria bacterium]|nr:glycosyltransferase family 2 protein [Actinomycetota bacterium]
MNATILVFFIIFIIYFFTLNFLYIGLTILAFFGSSREVYTRKYTPYKLIEKSTLTPPISIIIPAFNEELDVINSVYSALNSKYPEFEVIFVNDGSTDETFSLVKKEFGLHIEDLFYKLDMSTEQIKGVYTSKKYPNLKAIDKVNGGKADALNAGVNLAGYPFVVNTDADSIFDAEGLLRIGR